MELLSLHSPPAVGLHCSSLRKVLTGKRNIFGQGLTFSNSKRYPDATNLKFLDCRAQASNSGTTKANPGNSEVITQESQSEDENLAFVAGATGRVGSRTVRELLKLGFRVRAGIRNAQKAEPLVQSVQQMKLDAAVEATGVQPVEKLEIVECDLENQDTIGSAIGDASLVICCIGASEKEVFDVTGPYRIDYQATKNLIDAAIIAKVDHFILVTSLGTNKIGFPAALLNLFWGVLVWKRKAEEVLISSGLPYTIVRPGGMERPTDAYKETHNIVLAEEDTLFGGQVSNLQVAELIAFMAKNRSLSYCKVVEVIAETTATLTPFGELLAKIPSQRVDSSASKELQRSKLPDLSPISEAKSDTIEKEPAQMTVETTRPLSPYIVYEDLKPPTSPTPTPSNVPGTSQARDTGSVEEELKSIVSDIQTNLSESTSTVAEKESIQTEMKKARPLSPYIVYDDLRPPTSPTPTPSGGPKVHINVKQAESKPDAADVGISIPRPITADADTDLAKDEVQKAGHLSPYVVYDDLKPPTSPSPSVPTVSILSTSTTDGGALMPSKSSNDEAQPVPSDNPGVKEHSDRPKSRPLSPFTMYEDLKPPTSPMPS
ncbi:PREDICTED: protein TIC 62, chloroplastic isoform X2 [Nelumbo nucifera]|uniref:Protein TIC 62, chloroplastic isoform X2 n=1 Tax=Nelumbo nucifera TaxID=4432 RepID=A0A1U8A0A7_NELNU|nr:PREDICTED: protein TIC 62, chloroplastic isoform X2 [Nelumbo nucifera]